jgi:hypothetical protein
MWLPEQERLETMQQGSRILLNWMEDLLRTGLASLVALQDLSLESTASSMVDWKLPGVARVLRTWPALLTEEGWEELISLDLGRFRLLCSAMERFDTLDELTQLDALQYAGLSFRKEYFANTLVNSGQLMVIGVDKRVSQGLHWRRTWFCGDSEKPGYADDYAWGEEAYFEYEWKVGDAVEARFIRFPGNYPQRLWLLEHKRCEWKIPELAGLDDLESFGTMYAKALSKNPWLLEFPALLKNQRLYYNRQSDCWMLRDQNDLLMPASLKDSQALKLDAHKRYTAFGTWNGYIWNGLSYIDDGIHTF